MPWPFKTIKQQSSWPLREVLVLLAGTVLATPNEHRAAAAAKMCERGLRLAVRLANEFGVPPEALHSVLDAVIADEAKSASVSLFGGVEKLSA